MIHRRADRFEVGTPVSQTTGGSEDAAAAGAAGAGAVNSAAADAGRVSAGTAVDAAAGGAIAAELEAAGDAVLAASPAPAGGGGGDATDRFIQMFGCAATGDDTATAAGPPRSSGGVCCIEEGGVESEEGRDEGGVMRGVGAVNPDDAAEDAVEGGRERGTSSGKDDTDGVAEDARLTVEEDATTGRSGTGFGASSICNPQSAAKKAEYSSTINM